MDIHNRIRYYMKEHGWTKYELAKQADVPQSTITNIFKRNYVPSIPTLESICAAFGITLAQFFAEGDFYELTPEQKQLFDKWVTLTAEQKELLYALIEQMK